MNDVRKVFDTIPEKFDKWRPHYSQELFNYIIYNCDLDKSKNCLEIGPGTGQATEFALNTGCSYKAVELGENLTEYMKIKFSKYTNFKILNADFENVELEKDYFDLVYSAATIQWIPENTAYSKCFDLLKEGGYLAMFFTTGDYRTTDPALYNDIQEIYIKYFVTESPYMQRFNYENGLEYGFKTKEKMEFFGQRVFNADEYVEYIGTHCDHILIKSDYRDKFYDGIKSAIISHGNKITLKDTYKLYLYQK